MYVACFVNNKNGDAQWLASWRYPTAMFVAALAVIDIKLDKMTKH